MSPSQNNKVFMSGGLDKKLCVWNIPQKRVVHSTVLDEMITAAAFVSSLNDHLIAVGTESGGLLFFDTVVSVGSLIRQTNQLT